MVTSVKKIIIIVTFYCKLQPASITFNEAMSDKEFLRFLKEEGVPAEDCEIINSGCQFTLMRIINGCLCFSENIIGAMLFVTHLEKNI